MRDRILGITCVLVLLLALPVSLSAETTGASSAYGESIRLNVATVLGGVPIAHGPVPEASGSAPPAYNVSNTVVGSAATVPVLGTILTNGTIVVTATSPVPAANSSSSSATVENLAISVPGVAPLLTLNATAVQSQAFATGTCGTPITFAGSNTTLVNATLGGSIVGAPITIANNPAPNTVLIDLLGIKVVLNEQIESGNKVRDGQITVNAIHITFANAGPLGQVINGDIIVASSTAQIAVSTADISITGTDSPDPAAPGQTVTHTLTVTNNGPDKASDVVVTDTLPTNATYLGSQATCGVCTVANGVLTCNLEDMEPNHSETITIQFRAMQPGQFTNSASVTTTSCDAAAANNTTSVTTSVVIVPTSADLSIVKSDNPDPVTVGQNLTYLLAVRNSGPDTAFAVSVSDTLPGSVTFLSAIPSAGTCTGTQPVTCMLGDLLSGGSALVVINVRPNVVGAINNTATVSSPTNDPNPGNNTDSEPTTVVAGPVPPSVDLSVTKVDEPDPVALGSTLTYTINVHNNSTVPATGVILTDLLPDSVTVVSVAPSQGTCNSGATVRCALGTLAGGSSATITIGVRTRATGLIHNTVTVDGNEPDPNHENNTATVTTNVTGPQDETAKADLTLHKNVCPATATTTDVITYTITVINRGPDISRDVQVVDPLPQGVVAIDVSTSQGTCSGTTTIRCSLGDMAPNTRAIITIHARGTNPGTFQNSATVSSSTPDPNGNDNRMTATAKIDRPDETHTEMFIPIVGNVDGAAGTKWRSDLRLLNNGPQDALVTLEFFPAGTDVVAKTASRNAVVPLGAMNEGVFNSVIQSVAGVSGLGALRLTSNAPIAGGVRIYNDQRDNRAVGGTYGSFVRPFGAEEATRSGSLLLLSNRPDAAKHGYRTNIGYFNASDETAFITLRALASDGRLLGTTTLTALPWSNRMANAFDLISSVPTGWRTLDDFYVKFETTGSRVFVFATVTDNVTSDSIFIPSTPD